MEAFTNVVVGYGLAVAVQHAVFPLFALYASLADNMRMAAIFTVVSIIRSYSLRRVFEGLRARGQGRRCPDKASVAGIEDQW